MRIEVRPAAAVSFGLLLALDPADLLLPLLLAASLHEAGHLLALRLCRVGVSLLQIGFGGAILHTAPMGRWEAALTAAAGPAVNLLLFALLRPTAPVFALMNLMLAAGNLLPVFPLDGGRILSALCPNLAPRIGDAVLLLILLCSMVACVHHHLGLWPLLCSAALLAKTAVSRLQEEKLIAKSGFSVYNILRS